MCLSINALLLQPFELVFYSFIIIIILNFIWKLSRGQKIIDDASRCFNCGSYNHSLKDCRKPRDNAAVNNARNKYKKHHSSGSRNSTRYYQNSRGGKYDDLRPGALDAETRQLLGLKVL